MAGYLSKLQGDQFITVAQWVSRWRIGSSNTMRGGIKVIINQSVDQQINKYINQSIEMQICILFVLGTWSLNSK